MDKFWAKLKKLGFAPLTTPGESANGEVSLADSPPLLCPINKILASVLGIPSTPCKLTVIFFWYLVNYWHEKLAPYTAIKSFTVILLGPESGLLSFLDFWIKV